MYEGLPDGLLTWQCPPSVYLLSQNLHQVSLGILAVNVSGALLFHITQPGSVSQDPDAADVYQSPSGL